MIEGIEAVDAALTEFEQKHADHTITLVVPRFHDRIDYECECGAIIRTWPSQSKQTKTVGP